MFVAVVCVWEEGEEGGAINRIEEDFLHDKKEGKTVRKKEREREENLLSFELKNLKILGDILNYNVRDKKIS